MVTSRSRKVHAGQVVALDGPIPSGLPAPPDADAEVAVPVVWSDDDVIVVDKPAGVVVHPGAGNQEGTLVHGLLARFPDLAAWTTGQPGPARASCTGSTRGPRGCSWWPGPRSPGRR